MALRLKFSVMPSWIVRVLALAAVNFLAGEFALLLAIPPNYATALWPPSGIALGAVLLWGNRVVPGVFIASFLINIYTGSRNVAQPALVAVGIALASSLQAAVGAFLIRRFVGFPNPLLRQRDVLAFFALGGPVACFIAATISTLVLWADGSISASKAPYNWWTWWVGDSIGVLIFAPLVLILFATPRPIWARRKNTVGVPMLAAIAGVTVLFVYVNARERQRHELEFEECCLRLADELANQLRGYQEVIWSIGRYFESSEQVTRGEFNRFAEPTVRRLPGIKALSWNPKVPLSDLALVEARVRNEGFPHFQVFERDASGNFVPVHVREQYFPVVFIAPLERNSPALGYDVASEPARLEALEQALISPEGAMTGPVKLIQDMDGGSAVIFYTAVLEPHEKFGSIADRRRWLRGYAAGVFRVDDVVDEALSNSGNAAGIKLRILDATELGREREIYSGRWRVPPPDNDTPFVCEFRIDLGGRKWLLRFYATPEYVAALDSWQAWWLDAGGLAFVALLGIFLLILDGRAVELETTNAKLHEAVKSREEFLSIASHELRTPLTPLKLQLQSALRVLAKNTTATGTHERLMKTLGALDNQVDRLIRLVDDLLDTSRITAGRLVLDKQPVDVKQLVLEVLERHGKELRAAATPVKLDAPRPVVGMFDRFRMEQVITNLVTNAIKYAPKKPLHISISAKRERMTLTVRDEGPGLAPADLERIFERFERAVIPGQKGGLGLGLFIVRQIIEAHGGTVRVESEPGRGATFVVEMPLSAPKAQG